jgi:translation elongation factor aEF-1 beta
VNAVGLWETHIDVLSVSLRVHKHSNKKIYLVNMGEFVALIDVVPEDTDVEFEGFVNKLKNILPNTCTIEHYEIIPVAFGLKKARLRVRYPDEWGGTDKVEELLGQVEGIQGIEGIAFSKA